MKPSYFLHIRSTKYVTHCTQLSIFKKEKQDLNKNRIKLRKHLTHLNLGNIKKRTGTYESSKEKWNVSTYS